MFDKLETVEKRYEELKKLTKEAKDEYTLFAFMVSKKTQRIVVIGNLDFKDTLETLAERANIDLKRYEINNGYNNEKTDLKVDMKEII